jgi:hypothetical protein
MIVGVNYPWRRYGGDFGPTVWGSRSGIASEAGAVAAEFAAMAGAGVEVVRWFLFADARGGIRLDAGGWPDGFGEGTLEDLDTWLAIALAHAVRVVPVLFDHTLAFRAATIGGAAVGGHGRWLAEPTGHARLLDTVIGPLARRYGSRGSHAELGAAVFAWDLLNEPDWLVAEHAPSARVEQPMPFDVLAAWVRDACGVFHGADGHVLGLGRVGETTHDHRMVGGDGDAVVAGDFGEAARLGFAHDVIGNLDVVESRLGENLRFGYLLAGDAHRARVELHPRDGRDFVRFDVRPEGDARRRAARLHPLDVGRHDVHVDQYTRCL